MSFFILLVFLSPISSFYSNKLSLYHLNMCNLVVIMFLSSNNSISSSFVTQPIDVTHATAKSLVYTSLEIVALWLNLLETEDTEQSKDETEQRRRIQLDLHFWHLQQASCWTRVWSLRWMNRVQPQNGKLEPSTGCMPLQSRLLAEVISLAVYHLSEYTPHIFANILLYILMGTTQQPVTIYTLHIHGFASSLRHKTKRANRVPCPRIVRSRIPHLSEAITQSVCQWLEHVDIDRHVWYVVTTCWSSSTKNVNSNWNVVLLRLSKAFKKRVIVRINTRRSGAPLILTNTYFDNECRNYNVRFHIQCYILLWFSSVSTCARMRSTSREASGGSAQLSWATWSS